MFVLLLLLGFVFGFGTFGVFATTLTTTGPRGRGCGSVVGGVVVGT